MVATEDQSNHECRIGSSVASIRKVSHFGKEENKCKNAAKSWKSCDLEKKSVTAEFKNRIDCKLIMFPMCYAS